MPFSDPLVGGNTLTRAIKSRSYVANTSGWKISPDGTAEFNNVSIIGNFRVIGADGSEISIYQAVGGSGILSIAPPSPVNGVDIGAASLSATSLGTGPGAAFGQLVIDGPSAAGNPGGIIGMTTTSTGGTQVDITSDVINLNTPGLVVSWDAVSDYQTYTPVVGNDGTATYTQRTGMWKRIGPKTVHVIVDIKVNAAGSGASAISLTMPTNFDQSIFQPIGPFYFSAAVNGIGAGQYTPGGSGNTIPHVKVQQGGGVDNVSDITGAGLIAGSRLSLNAIYKEP